MTTRAISKAAVEKLSISLTPEFAADIRGAIAAGEYASTSEVIRDALRLHQLAHTHNLKVFDMLMDPTGLPEETRRAMQKKTSEA